jgi:hypothetical protein
MDAQFIADPDTEEQSWRLTSTLRCCAFICRFVPGTAAVIEISGGCHACLNEINVFALERGYRIERLPTD